MGRPLYLSVPTSSQTALFENLPSSSGGEENMLNAVKLVSPLLALQKTAGLGPSRDIKYNLFELEVMQPLIYKVYKV